MRKSGILSPPDARRIAPGAPVAVRLTIGGLVQGVGFRPFVHRLAERCGVHGWVRNAGGEVEVHAEADALALHEFVDGLRADAPVLARLESIVRRDAPTSGATTFRIISSGDALHGHRVVSPDVAICDTCLAELFDPANRRYRHAFITCTDCGPRFTVIESLPYDRERTSLRAFPQCPACLAEYRSPGSRRYHSETNCCPACGPSLWFSRTGQADRPAGAAAVAAAADLLRSGGILALRGLGGFHLAVDATHAAAVQRLRDRKGREAKPLAVMVRDLDDARAIGRVGPPEATLLASAARPIVLLDSSGLPDRLAAPVTRGLAHTGVMLAYTPLHHLLLAELRLPLVMTSGNRSDEPIATGNREAMERLGGIADGFLLHDREIVARYDDSVVRVVNGAPVMLRRSRGHAPLPMTLPVASPQPLLAVGPHLKNTFTLVDGHRACVSQHIGDLDNLETAEHFTSALARFRALFDIEPAGVVRDLHPGYLSTRLAAESGLPIVAAVQHHHAHIAAVMAEHGRTDPVIGVAFDGTGYGTDGETWGAEILHADLVSFRRLARFRRALLPGGDAAARAPWRAALGSLWDVPEASSVLARATQGLPRRDVELVRQQVARGVNSPRASSMGRLFDAAAAILGVQRTAAFEGEAAMRLEAVAGAARGEVLPFVIVRLADGLTELDATPALVALGTRAAAGEPIGTLAGAFHDTIVAATGELVRRASLETGCRTVALGGGCFQNARLLSGLRDRLAADGFEVLAPVQLGPNDGAISVGQAAVGAARLAGFSPAVLTADSTGG